MGGLDPGQKPAPGPVPIPEAGKSGTAWRKITEIPAKTRVYALTLYTISSDTHKPGDAIDLTLHEALVVEGMITVNKGARMQGVVEAVSVDSAELPREAFILRLSGLEVEPNRWVPIRSNFLVRVGPARHKVEKGFESLTPEYPAIYPTGSRLEFWLVEPAKLH